MKGSLYNIGGRIGVRANRIPFLVDAMTNGIRHATLYLERSESIDVMKNTKSRNVEIIFAGSIPVFAPGSERAMTLPDNTRRVGTRNE